MKSIKLSLSVGKTLFQALLLLLLLCSIGELFARTPAANFLSNYEAYGSSHPHFDTQVIRIKDRIAKYGKIDCIFLGDSQILFDVDPAIVEQAYFEETGTKIKCQNFGLGGLKPSTAGSLIKLIINEFDPRMVIFGTDLFDYSNSLSGSDVSIMSSPWVAYKSGVFSIDGWLIENSNSYRDYLGLNRYLLVNDNDTRYIDPNGHSLKLFGKATMSLNEQLDYYRNIVDRPIFAENQIIGLHNVLLPTNGVKIVILETPVNSIYFTLKKFSYNNKVYPDFVNILTNEVNSVNSELLLTQQTFGVPDDGWYDLIHLNQKGALLFSQQIGKRLGNIAFPARMTDTQASTTSHAQLRWENSLYSDLSVTSIGFFILTLITLGLYYSPFLKRNQSLVLLFGSYFFCLTWDRAFALILIIYSIFNYFIALKIEKSGHPTRNHWLSFGVIANLTALFFYKYFDQTQIYFFKALFRIGFTKSLFGMNLLQPIGISFYSLQAISYLIDVYRKQILANKSFIEVSLYLAYFPKLLAGPIERAQNFFTQLQNVAEIGNAQIIESFTRIFVGLSRKLIISDTIGQLIPHNIFTTPQNYSTPDLLFWWTTYAFIIYNDFAGYTSIARGVSGLFGIQLSPNFEQPFFSTSFIDFWNRWHISLSNWLRDYIYLPVSRAMLRRNPSGRYWPNLIIPPLLTMIVSGIWHGLFPRFILWGILNGILQGFERIQKLRKKNTSFYNGTWKKVWGILITLLVIILINVPFKLDIAQTLAFWSSIFRWGVAQHTLSLPQTIKPILAIGLSLAIDFWQLPKKDESGLLQLPRTARIFLLTAGLLLLFLATRQQISTPFIYQEF